MRETRQAWRVGSVAAITVTMDDGGRALMDSCQALMRTHLGARYTEDSAQVAAVMALAHITAGQPLHAALSAGCEDAARDFRQDARTDREALALDAEPTDVLDRLVMGSMPPADADYRTTARDALRDTLDALPDDAFNAAATWATQRPARLPLALTAPLRQAGAAVIAEHAARPFPLDESRHQYRSGAPVRDGRTGQYPKGQTWADGSPSRLAWRTERHDPTPAPGHRDAATSGPASLVVITRPDGEKWLTEVMGTGDLGPSSYRITDETAASILARPVLPAHEMTDEDASADLFAYATTPVGPVAPAPSSRKSRKSGGVGGPTTTRRARLDWTSRTRSA